MSPPHTPFDHYCPDWDYLRITEKDPEFSACQCCSDTQHEQARISAKLALRRREWEAFPDEAHGFEHPAQGNLFPPR